MALQLRCPSCNNRIEQASVEAGHEVTCTACGSSFRLDDLTTTGWTEAEKRFGRFKIVAEVGHGGFGTVFQARDPKLDRTIAVKIPRRGSIGDKPNDLERFLREARSAAQLQHPSIVAVHEVGVHDGIPYLVSDFVNGPTLGDFLTARLPTHREAAHLVAEVADALHYAHQHGVVHRDVKPSNIMLEGPTGPTRVGTPEAATPGQLGTASLDSYGTRLTDFGLAKRDAGEITVTVDGEVLGTPAYMSPEQASGQAHKVDGRSDIYSLGVILYQLLTGVLPFRGNKRMLLHQVLNDEPKSPRSLNDSIPRDLETITLKALAKEPGRRYEAASHLAADLRRYMAGEPIQARPTGTVERAWRWCLRNPLAASLAAIATLCLCGGTAISAYFGINATAAREKADWEAIEALKIAKKETAERERADREADAAWASQYRAHMSLIQLDQVTQQAGYVSHNARRIVNTLDRYIVRPANRRDVRGWEWYFHERAYKRGVTLISHVGFTSDHQGGTLALNEDGRLVARGGKGGHVTVWEILLGQDARLFKSLMLPDKEMVPAVAFTPSRLLAASYHQGIVSTWDVMSGEKLWSAKFAGGLPLATFSPDGEVLAIAGRDYKSNLWRVAILDAATGREIRVLSDLGPKVNAVSNLTIGPVNKHLAVRSNTGLSVWSLADGKEVYVANARSLTFSADGKQLITVDDNKKFNVWNIRNAGGGLKQTLLKINVNGFVNGLACSPDGALLAVAESDGSVALWQMATGERLQVAYANSDRSAGGVAARGLCFSADGTRLGWRNQDGTLQVWDLSSVPATRLLEMRHSDIVQTVAFNRTGNRLASGSRDGSLILWETASGRPLFKVDKKLPFALTFSPDGKRILTGTRDFKLEFLSAETGRSIGQLAGHTAMITSAVYSPSGDLLASAGQAESVKIWEVSSGECQHTFKAPIDWLSQVSFSADGKLVAVACQDGTVRIWDVGSGESRGILEGHSGPVGPVAFSRDGAWLASGGNDGTVILWDYASGREGPRLHGTSHWILSLCFSPDGTRLAVASFDGAVRFFDVQSGEEILTLNPSMAFVSSLALSPDGARLALAGANLRVMLLTAGTAAVENQARLDDAGLPAMLLAKPLPRSAVMDRIRRDKRIPEGRREQILKAADGLVEETDAKKFLEAAWPVIRMSHASACLCELAAAQTRAACAKAPDDVLYRRALGAALCRLGKFRSDSYPEALATLSACDRNDPIALAFLVMAQFHTGDAKQAALNWERLRALMKQEPWTRDLSAASLASEVETLMQPRLTK